jgi:hypothetical protein
MTRHINSFAGLIAAVAVVAGAPAGAAAAEERLGCRDVGFAVDRDVIAVGRDEGRFGAIKLTVRGNPIEIFNLRVVYGNGTPDDLEVRSEIKAGGETRWIDLRGSKDRAIRKIELVYRSIPAFRGQAVVCAYGR